MNANERESIFDRGGRRGAESAESAESAEKNIGNQCFLCVLRASASSAITKSSGCAFSNLRYWRSFAFIRG